MPAGTWDCCAIRLTNFFGVAKEYLSSASHLFVVISSFFAQKTLKVFEKRPMSAPFPSPA
jgi:hypothetical protein